MAIRLCSASIIWCSLRQFKRTFSGNGFRWLATGNSVVKDLVCLRSLDVDAIFDFYFDIIGGVYKGEWIGNWFEWTHWSDGIAFMVFWIGIISFLFSMKQKICLFNLHLILNSIMKDVIYADLLTNDIWVVEHELSWDEAQF